MTIWTGREATVRTIRVTEPYAEGQSLPAKGDKVQADTLRGNGRIFEITGTSAPRLKLDTDNGTVSVSVDCFVANGETT